MQIEQYKNENEHENVVTVELEGGGGEEARLTGRNGAFVSGPRDLP
jgi:hypothetical protein